MLIEQRVPVGHQRLTFANRRPHQLRGLVIEKPRLSAFRVDMRVSSEERQIDANLKRNTMRVLPPGKRTRCVANARAPFQRNTAAYLVPSVEQLLIRVPEEAADVRAAKTESRYRRRQAHRYGHLQVTPFGHIVSGPVCRVPLGTGEEGSGQDERSFLPAGPFQQAVVRKHYL